MLRLVLPGVALGVVAALALGRALEHMLYGIEPTDPVTFLQVVPVMLAAAALAAYLPARRAAAGDPMQALRAE